MGSLWDNNILLGASSLYMNPLNNSTGDGSA